MRDFGIAVLITVLVLTLFVVIARAVRQDESRPQIGKAVCVKTTVRADGSVHTETCIP